jgi:hypothetical protein
VENKEDFNIIAQGGDDILSDGMEVDNSLFILEKEWLEVISYHILLIE